ncbi:hypothetical protein ROLI_034620 [Roseobacter fucihabitans]|uniref:Uncharacterized protein n=1 Tax=Roseobacter fucihabitans TaxID=1537242 RepID=A0ABZ2BYT9_9RHOB|nr:hypothetical protein [Roseobacter litoralis]
MTLSRDFYDDPRDIFPDLSPTARSSSWRADGCSPIYPRPGPKCPSKWRFTDWAAL